MFMNSIEVALHIMIHEPFSGNFSEEPAPLLSPADAVGGYEDAAALR